MGHLKIPTKYWLLLIVLSPRPITLIPSLTLFHILSSYISFTYSLKQAIFQNNPIPKLILLPFVLLSLIKECSIACCYFLCALLILLFICNVSSMKTSLYLGCSPFYSQFLPSTWYIVDPQIHLLKE